MKEILDYEEEEEIFKYKKWAFRCVIYLVLLSGLGFYLITSKIIAFETLIFSRKFLILSWIFKIILCSGIFFTIMMVRNKETINNKYWISLIGISLFFLASVVFSFI